MSNAQFHLFSNSSSSIEQDVDVKNNNTATATGTTDQNRAIGQQAQPQQQSKDSTSSDAAAAAAAASASAEINQSTNSSTPTLHQPQPQSSKPHHQLHHNQNQPHQQPTSGSPTKDERFHKLIKKTINKLKLSPAVPTVASTTSTTTSPDSFDKQQQQQQQQQQLSPSHRSNRSQSSVVTSHQLGQSPTSQGGHLFSTPINRSRYNSVASCNSSSSDIFERSVSNGNPLSHFTNPETPFHHNIENYTSPILDTTAEILVNPNIQLEQVQLNCYCDNSNNNIDNDNNNNNDIPTSLPTNDSFKGRDSLFNPNYSTNNNNKGGGCSGGDCKCKPNNQSSSSLSMAPPPIPGSNGASPMLRPRARSIISQSIISTLDNSKHNSGTNTNLPSGNSNLSKVKSYTATTGLARPHISTLRSSSFAGNTCLLRNKPNHNKINDSGSASTAIPYVGKSTIQITRKSSPKLASLVTRSYSGANLATSPSSTNSATSPISNSSATKTMLPLGAASTDSDSKYTHSPTSKKHCQSVNTHPPVIDFYSFADMCTHEDEEFEQNVPEITKQGKEGLGDHSNHDGTDDDDDADEVDPLDETNIQEFGFNSITSSGSLRDGSFSTAGTEFSRDAYARRGSYATISAKDYIDVL
ncbi:hypothetical protein I9W82_001806 [Candida metapsilosis]|uniref:Uncharacterized protein n=1 Tax=Candida metapsilosis TaxID=273372 RepID=A0A8H7ZJ70_9ASCO|nr:hypothetical protein I9W82_001806 [Candida metapsilosis]